MEQIEIDRLKKFLLNKSIIFIKILYFKITYLFIIISLKFKKFQLKYTPIYNKLFKFKVQRS